MAEEDVASLMQRLRRIFGRIQCLPNAVACTQKACGRLWEQFDGGVRMLTNPIFYKIEKVGKAKRKATSRGKQIKASRAIIEARLDEEHRQIPFDEGRLKARQVKKARKRETKRRLGKKNNYRKPPQKKKGPATLEKVYQDNSSDLADRSCAAKKTNKKAPRKARKNRKGLVIPTTTSEDGPEDDSEDLFTRKKAPAKTRKTKKGGLGGKAPARHSTSEVPESSEDNAPDLPSVRVMRTKRVVISEEDEEGQDGEEEDEVDEEEEDEVDELEEDEEEDELEYMDVDVDDDDAMVL
jgi:hypothetical protein